jgi:hypothetical protein
VTRGVSNSSQTYLGACGRGGLAGELMYRDYSVTSTGNVLP